MNRDHHLCSAVELRLGEIRGRQSQDLVGARSSQIFALELLEPLPLIGRQARARPCITLGLPDPLPQASPRVQPIFSAIESMAAHCESVLALVLHDQPHRPLPDFR